MAQVKRTNSQYKRDGSLQLNKQRSSQPTHATTFQTRPRSAVHPTYLGGKQAQSHLQRPSTAKVPKSKKGASERAAVTGQYQKEISQTIQQHDLSNPKVAPLVHNTQTLGGGTRDTQIMKQINE